VLLKANIMIMTLLTVTIKGRVYPTRQVVKLGQSFVLKCDADEPVVWYFESVMLPNVSIKIKNIKSSKLVLMGTEISEGTYTCIGQVTQPTIWDPTIRTFYFKSSANVFVLGKIFIIKHLRIYS